MSAAEVTIEEWLEVWGGVVGRARKLSDLPMWLQYYPKTLFDTINRSGSGVISKNELRWRCLDNFENFDWRQQTFNGIVEPLTSSVAMFQFIISLRPSVQKIFLI